MADSQSQRSLASESFHGLLIDGVTPTGTVLGRGSYGQVLEVDWHGTICAAKNVHEIFLEGVSAAESRKVINDFERECQTWAQLRHPNVVQLLGVYFKKDSSAPILVLEKMDTTLSGYLEQHSKEKFPLHHKVSVLRQVAQALSFLHSQNPPLVHHDLSTNNILLCEWSFQAKITDFGMTRPISVAALTRRSSIKGTLAFMAPEALCEPPRYDAKLDVFSLGNVITATLSHKWPTPDVPTRYEGGVLVAHNEFKRREHHIMMLSEDEKAHFLPIIQKSLDNRPDHRPTSSEVVAEVKRIGAALVQQVPGSKSSWPVMCAELTAERDTLVTERNMLETEKHELEETVARQNARVAELEETVALVPQNNMVAPSVQAQLDALRPLLNARLQEGTTWYLVDVRWMKQWKRFVGFDTRDRSQVGEQSANPGPIDNKSLLAGGFYDTLKDHLMEDLDYSLVPEGGWNKLVIWYGLAEGSRPIARKVIEWGMYVKHLKVEMYPIRLELGLHPLEEGSTVTKTFSRVDKMYVVKKAILDAFQLSEGKECRLWHRYMTDSYEQVKDDDMLQESGIYTGQLMILEVKKDDGTWPRETFNPTCSSDTSLASSYSSPYNTRSGGYSSSSSGLCGLQNLGNTCFMNSALQCLSNSEPLMEYFLSKSYLKHINKKNPNGMGGQLADAYGSLMQELWNEKLSCTAPRTLKSVIDQHAPQFKGSTQPDSQELLAFLLDGLHEDLNQVIDKPYVDMSINSAGREDQEISKEAWQKYLLRNRSVIVNLFKGQIKTTLVCPDCQKVSRVFDPLMCLSLPLPVEKTRWLEVHLVRIDPSFPVEKYQLKLPKQGSINHLQEEMAKLSGLDKAKMVTIDVYQHRFHRIYEPREGLNHILDRDDIYVYEVPVSSAEDPNWVVLPVYHREHYSKTFNYSYSGGSYTQNYARLFGLPILVTVPRYGTTYQSLYQAIVTQCRRYVRTPVEVNKGEEEGEEKVKGEDGEPVMFEILTVNAYGSQTLMKLKKDETDLTLGGNLYLACDWEEWKEKCYDEDMSKETVEHASMREAMEKGRKSIDIHDCLEFFTQEKKLGEDDPWYCPQCKDMKQATKKFDLWKLPEVLVIHLKRFTYNRSGRDKLDALVHFPHELDLSKYVSNPNHLPPVYDLYAVINHYGGLGGGHYTAFCQNKDSDKWFSYDDSHVSETDASHVMTSAAYVLFYRQRDTRALRKSANMN